MGTVSRNGMIFTINGLTRNGRSGVDAIKAINTEIGVGLAIAEASRRGTSRLMDSSSSGAEAVAYFDLIRVGD